MSQPNLTNATPSVQRYSPDIRPNGRRSGTVDHPDNSIGYAKGGNPGHGGGGGGGGQKTNNGIYYHGGPVMLGDPNTGSINVYYIYYGTWGGSGQPFVTDSYDASYSYLDGTPVDTSTDQALLENYPAAGGSPYFNINTTYYDGSNNPVPNNTALAGTTTDNYSRGTSLGDSDIQGIVTDAINSGALPQDVNGVYFVLTSMDVDESSGFCSAYCGWHTHGQINGADIKYSFVGDPARCPNACSIQDFGPNNTITGDGAISIVAHELEEASTDPDLNAWYDHRGYENADKCAWTYGTTYTVNGNEANMNISGTDYLIQRNWVDAGGGYCALSY